MPEIIELKEVNGVYVPDETDNGETKQKEYNKRKQHKEREPIRIAPRKVKANAQIDEFFDGFDSSMNILRQIIKAVR